MSGLKCAMSSVSTATRWRRLDDQCPVQRSSRPAAAIHHSAIAFAWGARTGVRSMWIPSLADTASKMLVNLPSRSRIKRKRRDKPAWRRRWKSSTSRG
jgi:hypothetical protein